MKIFLIGPTGSGKTSAAYYFEKNIGFIHIQASKILSDLYPQLPTESRNIYKKRLTDSSYKILQSNYLFFVDSIKKHIQGDNNYVIEGVRNPQDFAMLYNPHIDVVRRFDGKYLTPFEEHGLGAIDAILSFIKIAYPNANIHNWSSNINASVEENFITNIIPYE